MTVDPKKKYVTAIQTNMGTVTAELYPEDAPKTVNNFVFLAREGYYDGVPFHRIVKGFMAQTGDPTGSGAGGPGYTFEDEPVKRNYVKGTLAMANRGPNTNGSQFFIVFRDYNLPKQYTIFGKVTSGDDTLQKLEEVPVKPNRGGEPSQPTVEVKIEKVTIQEQ
ncbi:MAG: peptidylprolyl isomerase [Chloroflexi bacterium]|nr:peptidylprolyl isomerase [Chloroflexota bacterium]